MSFQLYFRFVIFLTECFIIFPFLCQNSGDAWNIMFYYSFPRWFHFCCILGFLVFYPHVLSSSGLWSDILDVCENNLNNHIRWVLGFNLVVHYYVAVYLDPRCIISINICLQGDTWRHQTSSCLNIDFDGLQARSHQGQVINARRFLFQNRSRWTF